MIKEIKLSQLFVVIITVDLTLECRINLVGLSFNDCEKASWNLTYTKEQMKRNEMSEMIFIIGTGMKTNK